MENYSHPDIPEILNKEGNSFCVDCGTEKPKWASMNNGVFLCLKCAGIHRGFGMSISLIRSLQIDSWTEKQLLYLTKGGNKNFKDNLSEFNIAETAELDIKYKSKAADYYRKYLKNEVDRESDPNYVPTQIIKPEIDVAMEIIELKEEEESEEKKENPEEKDKQIKKKFFGFMGNILNKVKEGTTGAAKKVGKGIADLKIGDKLKVAGNAIAGAAKTSGHFIADKTIKAAQKTKEGMSSLAEKTKKTFRRGNQNVNSNTNDNLNEGDKKEEEKKEEEKKEEDKRKEEKKEEEKKEEDKKEEDKKEEDKKEEEKKEEEKKEEEKKEDDKKLGNSEVPEEKVEPQREMNENVPSV